MWPWILVWLLVLTLGGTWLLLLAREVFRKGLRLVEELDAAAQRVDTASGQSDSLLGDVR